VGNFQLRSLSGPETSSGPTEGAGFGKALAGQIEKLAASQADAADQAQKLATGGAQDVTSVVMAVEKASLELQLATQIRNKGVEAYQEIFRMTV
jgi:flagellar hook-basal body complex protein FliE